MEKPYTDIGKEIKMIRELRHMTQVEMAEAVKISERQYQRIEAGVSVPSIKTLYSIASVLGVGVDFLLTPSNPSITTCFAARRAPDRDRKDDEKEAD